MKENKPSSKIAIWALTGSLVLIGFLLFQIYSIQHPSTTAVAIPQAAGSVNLWAIFLTGLFVGGLSCLAVQGGLLAATIANREEEKLKGELKSRGSALPILSFLGAKLVAYTLLGFLLGMLGSVVQLSLMAKTIMQFAVVVFMLGTAFNILEIHPIFRYFALQPPKFLTRLVRKQSKRTDLFAPVLLGAFTVFIPCGTTQAMMALSIASGSAIMGATILAAFVLGTSPLFFILGYFATRLGDAMHQRFMKLAAVALILLALYNLDGALALSGSPFTISGLFNSQAKSTAQQDSNTKAVSEATVNITSSGYSPNLLTIKAGSQVTLHLVNNGGQGCTQAFTIPSLGIQKVVPLGNSDTVTFTAPTQPGNLAFMCSMGMYRGNMEVI